MKKDLKNNLHKLYKDIEPPPNINGMNDTIMKVRQIVNEVDDSELTFFKFYFEQFEFIRKKVWIIQFVILLICGFKLYNSTNMIQTIAWISAATPIIFLAGFTELSRTYTYKTMEIEMSTQFSFKQVMMSRISILGLVDILCITILCLLAGAYTDINPYIVFIYICIPFMVTCFGCIWLLNRVKGRECNYFCFTLGAFVMGTVAILTNRFPTIYISSSFWIWCILLFISVIGVCLEIYKLLDSCNKKLDNMNLSNM